MRYLITANAVHGLPLTNADKQRAVTLALQEFPAWSDRFVAGLVKVSPTFVGKIRGQTYQASASHEF